MCIYESRNLKNLANFQPHDRLQFQIYESRNLKNLANNAIYSSIYSLSTKVEI